MFEERFFSWYRWSVKCGVLELGIYRLLDW